MTRFKLYLNKENLKNEVSILRFYKTEEAIKNLTHQNSNCVDVGASKGDVLDFFINHCKYGHHVAIEVIPIYSQFLSFFYRKKNVAIFNLAVSNCNKQETLYLTENSPGNSGITQVNKVNSKCKKISVTSDLLDSILAKYEKIDVIKINCIGSELKVLQGAEATLKKNKPLIFLECTKTHNSQQTINEIFEIFDKNDYQVSILVDYPKLKTLNNNEFSNAILNLKTYHFIAT